MTTIPKTHHQDDPDLPLRSFIAYDDFTTGVRGRNFAAALASALGSPHGDHDSLWRFDLFATPGNADELARAAADSDFVILSLRGDRDLPEAVRTWMNVWLPLARSRPVSLVALFRVDSHDAHRVQATRSYLREAALAAGIDFFAHCSITPEVGMVPAASQNERETEQPAPGRGNHARRWPASAAA